MAKPKLFTSANSRLITLQYHNTAIERIDRLANQLGVARSTIIRVAVEEYIQSYGTHAPARTYYRGNSGIRPYVPPPGLETLESVLELYKQGFNRSEVDAYADGEITFDEMQQRMRARFSAASAQ